MSYSAANTRQVVIEALEGTIGSTFTMDTGVFAFGTFAGQPTQATIAKAIQTSTARHWFDVQVGSTSTHDASPVSALSTRRICKVPIRIDLVTHLATTIQESKRKAYVALVEQEATRACTVLRCPGNLTTTNDGGATGIIGGLLRGPSGGGPSWVKDEEDWTRQLLRSHIEGEAIVEVVQARSPDDIYGVNLVAWHRSDDVTQSQGVFSAVNDRAGSNDLTAEGSPVYTTPGDLNFTPDLVFDGTDDRVVDVSGHSLGTSDTTIWILLKANTWLDQARVMAFYQADFLANYRLRMRTASWEWIVVGSTGSAVTATSATGINDDGYHLIRLHVDSTTTDTVGIGVDGETPTTTAFTHVNADIDVFSMGGGYPTGTPWAGINVKEVLVVNTISTSAQDDEALDYFRTRYGLSI